VLSPAHLLPTSSPPLHRPPPPQHTLKNMPQPSEVETGEEKIGELKDTQEAEPTKPSSQSALTTLPSSPAEAAAEAATAAAAAAAAATGGAAAAVTPAAMSVTLSAKPEKPPLPLQPQLPLQQHTSSPPLSKPKPLSVSARPAQQQQSHHSNKVPVSTGAVPLPDGAHSHFFLSHAQSTGGDQTNAIYLELRQLGFTCW
jgi:hypothetical protein